MAPTELSAVLTQSMEIAPGLSIMRVVPDGWELPEFTPGQFAVIGLPGSAPRCDNSDPDDEAPGPDALIRRAYSIASSSLARRHLEFYITLVHSGALTPRLFALDIGDRLWLSSKFTGRFTLDEVPDEANVVLISTGTGLAPYMSMVRTLVKPREDRRIAIIQAETFTEHSRRSPGTYHVEKYW